MYNQPTNCTISNYCLQTPNHYCDEIIDNRLKYRLSSESEDNWREIDLSRSATSAEISDLEPGEYVVTLTVTNNQQLTTSDTKTYDARPDLSKSDTFDIFITVCILREFWYSYYYYS